MKTFLLAPLLALFSHLPLSCAAAGSVQQVHQDSGGPLLPEQAAYDVLHYDLEIAVDPQERSIRGSLLVRARILEPLGHFVLDLDQRLSVERVVEGERALPFVHEEGHIRADLGRERAAGELGELRVFYGGRPRIAPRPPWEGGFTWERTASGAHWIATSNQGEGADLWWPCKDHPSDEPESMWIRVTVPAPLICASNGRLEHVDENEDGTRTFHWYVSTPINNYGVALNIAPYETIEREYTSVTGGTFPVTYWVLPENVEQGKGLMEQILAHLRHLEGLFGPYPFRADKYGVAETPHLGMEHQTIIAYGNRYRDNKWGFDWLHHHELAHEWFANLVTAPDWNDFWIHEGFGTYAQNLYVEKLHGAEAYHQSMADIRPQILNARPVAPRESRTSGEMYFLDLRGPEGRRRSDSDIYHKGAWFLHTLRYLVGDEDFFLMLRRMAYPDPALELVTDGSHCRFGTTDEFLAIAEKISGAELAWLFEVYLRQPELPWIETEVDPEGGRLHLRWRVPRELPFPMPVELRIGTEVQRVAVPEEGASVELPPGVDWQVDPHSWILAGRQRSVEPAAKQRER